MSNFSALSAGSLNSTIAVRANDGVFKGVLMPVFAMRPGFEYLVVTVRVAAVVLQRGNGLKVGGVHAGTITAEMVKGRIIRDKADEQCVSEAMACPSPRASGVSVCGLELPIPVDSEGSPLPALIRTALINLSPETRFQRADNTAGRLVDHRVAVFIPAPIVHCAPPTLFGRFKATRNGAHHV